VRRAWLLVALVASAAATSCGGLLGINEVGPEDAGSPDAGSWDVAAPDALPDALQDTMPESAAADAPPDSFEADAPSCFPLPTGIVSWWRAEGNAADSIGTNKGTPTNVTYVPGVVGQAFHVAGNGYVSAAAVGLPVTGADRTMEAWVRLAASYDGSPRTTALFLGYGGWGTGGAVYDICAAGSSPNSKDLLTWSQWGGGIAGPSLSENEWHHVAATLAEGTVVLYLDGSAMTEETDHFPVNTTNDGSVYMGGLPAALYGTSDPNWLIGDVDEATAYSRALSADEIQGIFKAGSLGKCP
jgi:hypothetical protein